MSIDSLLQTVREACTPSVWSRGVSLARVGAVMGQQDSDEEIELRVATKGLVAPEVVLYPVDGEWSCDCGSDDDPCEHVAAAVIALKQARADGRRMPGDDGREPFHVRYRFTGRNHPLALRRTFARDGEEIDLPGSLIALSDGRITGPRHVVSQPDLRFEAELGSFSGGTIPKPLMAKLLGIVADANDLHYEGDPTGIGPAVSGLCVRVGDHDGGFLVRLEQDPSVSEVFENGALRRGNTIHPIVDHGLGERMFLELRKGRLFSPDQAGNLAGELLPKLRRKLPIVVETDRLPGSRSYPPRLQIVTERQGDEMVVLAHVVYGDPPVARVDGDRITILRGGEVPVRKPDVERRLVTRMVERLGLEPGVKRVLAVADAITLAEKLRSASDLDVSIIGAAYEDFRARAPLVPRLAVRDPEDVDLWFELDEPATGRPTRVEAADVLRAWERGDTFAGILGGGFGQVPVGWLERHGHRIAALLAAKAMAGERGRSSLAHLLPDVAALCESLDVPPPAACEKLRALLDDFSGIEPATLPADLSATLREYQRVGVDWLCFLRQAGLGALLADDMGLGKTLQTLCALNGRVLVVAPTSVLHNWASEIARFRPGLKSSIYHGSNRGLDEQADVTLTTYAILRLDVERLATVDWDVAVLDEAQNIKNPDSKVARAAYRLRASCRIALTGTPVENRLDDLWSEFNFIAPGLLGTRTDFAANYVRRIANGDQNAATSLRERIRPFVLRRTKREVARELPPRTDVVLRCELGDSERQVYDAVRFATQEDVARRLGAGANTLAVLEALLRLRQAACHPALLPGQEDWARRPSAKILLLLETLDEIVAEGHKALVFSQWTSMLDLIEPHLTADGLSFVRLDGSTRDRESVVARFQAADGPPIMLVSLKAGGTGLNLTAADNVFLVDPWWNPAVEDQAADRAHRIGQENPVLVHRLVAAGTVEERILALQERKRTLAATAVGDGSMADRVTREDLLALLE